MRAKDNLCEVPLFKTKFVLCLSKNHFLSDRTRAPLKDLKAIFLYSDSYPNNKHYELISSINYKKLFFLPYPAQVLHKISISKRGTILPALYQRFHNLVDLSQVSVISIEDYDDEFFISLCFLPENLKIPSIKHTIDYIFDYPFKDFVARYCIK